MKNLQLTVDMFEICGIMDAQTSEEEHEMLKGFTLGNRHTYLDPKIEKLGLTLEKINHYLFIKYLKYQLGYNPAVSLDTQITEATLQVKNTDIALVLDNAEMVKNIRNSDLNDLRRCVGCFLSNNRQQGIIHMQDIYLNIAKIDALESESKLESAIAERNEKVQRVVDLYAQRYGVNFILII